MARPRRGVDPPAGQRDWRANPARARFPINPETGAPDPPYKIGDRDLRLRGASLERVQADVERWERDNPQQDHPTYEELDEEGKRIADERMVRKFRERDR